MSGTAPEDPEVGQHCICAKGRAEKTVWYVPEENGWQCENCHSWWGHVELGEPAEITERSPVYILRCDVELAAKVVAAQREQGKMYSAGEIAELERCVAAARMHGIDRWSNYVHWVIAETDGEVALPNRFCRTEEARAGMKPIEKEATP